jgi:perosamine synthetase
VITAIDFAGHPADLDELARVAASADALLVEDASHSIGARYRDKSVGAVADLTTFSFHPVKTITTGEGGAVSSPISEFHTAVRRFRNHGLVRERSELRDPDEGAWHQEVHRLGLNYRMPDILAALGLSQLRRLDSFVARRRELVNRYCEHLKGVDGLNLPTQRPYVTPAWHLFSVRILDGRRRNVFEYLRQAGIGVQVHYLPAHLHPAFLDLGYRPGMCPVAEESYDQLLSLPLYPDLTFEQQDRVMTEVRRSLSTR